MEEEDESRGKTEESGEDRGDGPPDRDPTLSPSAFILICHSKSGEINPVKVSNLVRAYVQRYRYFRKHGRKPGDPPGPPRPPKEPGPPDKGGPGLPLPPL
uniref:Splicing factor, arginine/serine-rich 19 isoform 8 n=6 Tax=Boreoeutheria TaxID=1437010 RepID=A0A2U8BR44_HUMAN|nr:splicing factor, arginine/serine-rich 19 isoform 8 [Homo sapiens]